ncbi:cyclic pyranopterin monophosphate synthase [Neisseria weaveri]|uniref:cyclic pyranopterin monophosphate synthase n=1 Tax=Neisseria weaveri TaxID=28091 RepID=UPI0007C9CEC3|nr:cyclic pyranopterin monophosphate synthase MoaC [Neisseria weaveri]SAY52079.1 Molybdenum cofactor biosynthesis protein C [Neisseria weaveri]
MINLTHLNENHTETMVDPSNKPEASATAKACGYINMNSDAIKLITQNNPQKTDVLGIARIAAIQGAKQTGFLIPLCQPAPLNHIRVDFESDLSLSRIKATVTATGNAKHSVEMDALMGVNIALLTIYDLLKAVDKNMALTHIHLQEKTNSKSENFTLTDKYENINY